MGRVFPVARREYLERVRSKAFLLGTFLGPVLMAGLMVGPALIAARQRGNPLKVAVLDASGGSLREAVEDGLRRAKEGDQPRFLVQAGVEGPAEEARARLKQAVVAKQLDGYLYLPPGALEGASAEYHGRNVSNRVDLRLLERAVDQVMVSRRLSTAGLDPEQVRSLTRRLDLKTIRLSEKGGEQEDRGVTFLFSTILMMMLYVTVLMWGQAVMTGVIEEKSSRIVELAVSAMPSTHLLAGKLLGVGAVGLTQFLVWAASLVLVGAYGRAIAPSEVPMPEITPLIAVSFVIFFLLGYFLYAALYAAIGSAVNTVQEAQSLVFPAIMPLIVSMVFFPVVIQSPDSPLSVGLSLFPFAAPLLMFLRITVLTPPLWQIALSMLLTLATVVAVNWVAARIYRVGILMYGKRPTFPELMRWVRHP